MLLAQEVGVKPTDVNYVAYDGGGELLAGILGGDVKFAATGVGEVAESAAAGDVRILAVTSEEAVEGVDAPTLTDEGVDLVFANWRGIVAPPGSPTTRRRSGSTRSPRCTTATPGRRRSRTTAGPTPSSPATSSASYLTDESDRVESVMSELGLA